MVDDDAALLDVLSMHLEDAGYEVRQAADGRAALELHQRRPASLIISDVNMPRMDGFALCRALREAGDSVPLLMLTSRVDEIDEALGLDLGADDYVTKPLRARVLLARVRMLLRRRGAPEVEDVCTTGPLRLDLQRLQAQWRSTPFETTLTEFRLLHALAARPGIPRGRDVLMREARGDDSVVDPRIIDTYIRRLRRRLEAIDPAFAAIETVVGVGYRWQGP